MRGGEMGCVLAAVEMSLVVKEPAEDLVLQLPGQPEWIFN
jgi:hypothetical protein